MCYSGTDMTFRMYIILMSLATFFAWAAWAVILWNTNPFEAGLIGFVMFYLTLFISLVGTLTLLGVSYRVLVRQRRDVVSREVRISFRHAVVLSLLGVTALAVSAQGKLRWWMVVLLILAGTALEYLFLIQEEARRS